MRFAFLLTAVLVSPLAAKDPCVSGPAPGGKAGPYSFLVASGPQRGQPTCYVCETAEKAGVIVFARSATPQLGKLMQKRDKAVEDRPKGELTAWMTVLGEKTLSIDALGKWAKEQGLKVVPTGVFDDPVGPPSYKLASDADITVILFLNRKVTATFAYHAGNVDDAAVKAVNDGVTSLGKK